MIPNQINRTLLHHHGRYQKNYIIFLSHCFGPWKLGLWARIFTHKPPNTYLVVVSAWGCRERERCLAKPWRSGSAWRWLEREVSSLAANSLAIRISGQKKKKVKRCLEREVPNPAAYSLARERCLAQLSIAGRSRFPVVRGA